MKKLLLAAALLTATPAHAGLTDNFWVKKIGIAWAASGMCGLDLDNDAGEKLMGQLGNAAVKSTGESVYAIEYAAKAYAMQVHDRVMDKGTKIEFCRNIYNGNW
jgi:hypothetical protein